MLERRVASGLALVHQAGSLSGLRELEPWLAGGSLREILKMFFAPLGRFRFGFLRRVTQRGMQVLSVLFPGTDFDLKLESGSPAFLILDPSGQSAQTTIGQFTQSTVTIDRRVFGRRSFANRDPAAQAIRHNLGLRSTSRVALGAWSAIGSMRAGRFAGDTARATARNPPWVSRRPIPMIEDRRDGPEHSRPA